MTVVAFSPARFTPNDLDEFGRIAEKNIRLGRWAGVTRETSREGDRLLVRLPGAETPIFRFERDRTGRYLLHFNDRAGWYGIGLGTTAAECLAIWLPNRIKRPSR